MAKADLARFLNGYRDSFDQALAEIRRGRKRAHWMWFIFPQINGLGTSPTAAHYAIQGRAEADAFLTDPTLGAGYRQLVDAVWTQVVTNRVTIRHLFGSPDDHKLVSSLTLFAGVAADLDAAEHWTRFVEQANEILDQAEAQRLPRCAITQGFLELAMLDPETAPLSELNRELTELQTRYRNASHVVGQRRERPDGIDDTTLNWWIAAHNAIWRRRFELNEQPQAAPVVEEIELRKERLRKPPR